MIPRSGNYLEDMYDDYLDSVEEDDSIANQEQWIERPIQMTKPENPSSREATLRDMFAAQALSGILSNRELSAVLGKSGHPMEVAAESAYKYADALLAERGKTNE